MTVELYICEAAEECGRSKSTDWVCDHSIPHDPEEFDAECLEVLCSRFIEDRPDRNDRRVFCIPCKQEDANGQLRLF